MKICDQDGGEVTVRHIQGSADENVRRLLGALTRFSHFTADGMTFTEVHVDMRQITPIGMRNMDFGVGICVVVLRKTDGKESREITAIPFRELGDGDNLSEILPLAYVNAAFREQEQLLPRLLALLNEGNRTHVSRVREAAA